MQHRNNFGLIRLLAAIQVLFVHAFNHFEIEHWSISALKVLPGVPVFFFVSGLMIYGSYSRNLHAGLRYFFKNRFLRIYPGLWVCLGVSILSLVFVGYWGQVQPSLKAVGIWLFTQFSFMQFYNPDFLRGYGVGSLNGALWTISVELQFYLLVPFLFALLVRSKKLFLAALVLSVGFHFTAHHIIPVDSIQSKMLRATFLPWIFIFGIGFWIGHVKELKERILKIPFYIPLVLFLLCMNFIGPYRENASNSMNPMAVLFLLMLILKFGYWDRLVDTYLNRFASKTDLSYGMYLYHMPVINYLLYVNHFSSGMNVALTMMMSTILGAMSWFFVEKPCLKLKN